MKQFLAILLIFGSVVLAGDKKQHDHGSMSTIDKMTCELKEGEACAAISVPTAQCSMCEKTIGKALQDVKGVSMAKVDAEAKTAHVHYASADVKVVDLEKAIAAAGYDANDVKRDEDAHAKLPQCCQMEKER